MVSSIRQTRVGALSRPTIPPRRVDANGPTTHAQSQSGGAPPAEVHRVRKQCTDKDRMYVSRFLLLSPLWEDEALTTGMHGRFRRPVLPEKSLDNRIGSAPADGNIGWPASRITAWRRGGGSAGFPGGWLPSRPVLPYRDPCGM